MNIKYFNVFFFLSLNVELKKKKSWAQENIISIWLEQVSIFYYDYKFLYKTNK